MRSLADRPMIESVTQGADTGVAAHPMRRLLFIGAASLLFFSLTAAPAAAQDGGASKVGDLTGNLPPAVYLLIPLALFLALLTALALGPLGNPGTTERRSGGVSRALTGREDAAERP
jgi:hypothetical protein